MNVKFDVFYGGHVAMDDIGYAGTPVDDRILSDAQLASAYGEARAMAELMDGLGYDTMWLAEHHFQHEGHGSIPNPTLVSVYLAQHAKNINFGSWFNTVTAWHPLRLAEDFALADVLSGGRMKFGVGRGYIAREVETLGAPLDDDTANREYFEEQLEILFKAFTKRSFSHRGKHFDLPARVQSRGHVLEEITLVPRPTKPVEVWQPIQSGTQRGFDLMAEYGIKGVILGGTKPGGKAEVAATKYQEALGRVGRNTELGEDMAIAINIHMADTVEKAINEATPFHEELIKVMAPLDRFPHLTTQQILSANDPTKASDPGLPKLEEGIEDGTWICGPPEHVAENIIGLLERFPGLERLSVVAGGLGIPPSVLRETIEVFAKEVKPKIMATVS